MGVLQHFFGGNGKGVLGGNAKGAKRGLQAVQREGGGLRAAPQSQVPAPQPLFPPAGLFPLPEIYIILYRMSRGTKKFLVDQRVVYPSQGVGLIKSIEEKKFKEKKVPYYMIYIEVSDMTIMVPVDKAAELGIRAIVPKDDALRALELIGEEFEPISTDWKLRYQTNLDLLKKGSVLDIATIVRSLYHRSKVKELPILERKLYDSALKLLEDEVSCSLKKTKEEVENMIFARLEAE